MPNDGDTETGTTDQILNWVPVCDISAAYVKKWIRPRTVLSVDNGCQCIFTYQDGDRISTGAKPFNMSEEEFRARCGLTPAATDYKNRFEV